MRQTVCYISLVLLLAMSSGLVHAVSQADVDALTEQSDKKKMEYKKLQAESVALSLELAKMNRELVEAAKRVQQDEDGISKTEQELKFLQDKYARTKESFNKEYQNLATVLASIQNLALHAKDPLIFQPLTPVEIIQSAILMRESVPYLKGNADKIKKDLTELNTQKEALQKKLVELSNKAEELKRKQVSIKKLVTQKGKLHEQLEGQKSQAREDAIKLASQASDLKDLMEKALKEAELQRRKKEELARIARQKEAEAQRKLEEEQIERIRAGRSAGFENQPVVDDNAPQFADEDRKYDVVLKSENKTSLDKNTSARGQFIRPARGDIVTSYGQELSKGVNAKGIVIKTRAGAQVVAPYDGTVVFSGPFKGYGNLIIINHGADIVSLVGGMSNVEADNGQMVLAGEPIGLMPDTKEAKLYMEIRKNTKPINPVPWLGQ